MKHILLTIVTSLLVINITSTVHLSNTLWPEPTTYSSDPQGKLLHTNFCGINFTIQASPPSPYPRQIIDFYLTETFKCSKATNNISVIVTIKDNSVMIPTQTSHQSYSLNLTDNLKWTLKAQYYPGFLRGLQTLSQLFVENKSETNYQKKHTVSQLPIFIKDTPAFSWRGIMIDSSRHFLPISLIKHTIDGMLYNKMNVLHWHIIDSDSFPMQVPSRPQLSDFGKFEGTYSQIDLKSIIQYAKLRGIRVIPQIDTPGHTQSWGRSSKYQQIVVKCDKFYDGQLDPTIQLTYNVVKDVMTYINNTFIDDYVHMGGDEVQTDCWDLKPSIKQWMLKNNISNYNMLQTYYRKQQKSIWRNITTKKAIYWANEQIDLPLQNQDVIHWWGDSTNVSKLVGRPNQIILSNYDQTYMDVGFGEWIGVPYKTYITWRKAYQINLKVLNTKILGAQSAIWSELNNQNTQDLKLWLRTCSIAQRTWNDSLNLDKNIINIVKRLVAQSNRMRSRGFKVTPVSTRLCEKQPQLCF